MYEAKFITGIIAGSLCEDGRIGYVADYPIYGTTLLYVGLPPSRIPILHPGYKKEDVKAELKDGYLTITGTTKKETGDQDKKGKYVRRERYCGSCSRSFYVGKAVEKEDIKAKFEDGVLKISVPKKEEKPKVEESKYISIEG